MTSSMSLFLLVPIVLSSSETPDERERESEREREREGEKESKLVSRNIVFLKALEILLCSVLFGDSVRS